MRQQSVLRKILEKVCITKKFTQCKISRTFKILKNCFQNTNCFSWIKLIPVLIHLKYRYYNSPNLELLSLPHHLSQTLSKPNETSLQHNPPHVLHRFLCFVLPHSTKRHHQYRIYQTTYQANAIKNIIKLYIYQNTLWVKKVTLQKAESLRAASHPKLGNTVNRNSIFNTRCAEFSTKW